jgi:hypothetical protein
MRALTVISILVALLIAACLGLLFAKRQADSVFILPSASHVSSWYPDYWAIVIEYDSAEDDWPTQIALRATRAGWTRRQYSNPGASDPRWSYIPWFTRRNQVGPLVLQEHVQFMIDEEQPNHVHLQITRRLSLDW